MTFQDELRAQLVELGVDDIHSWRCSHPDIYGDCKCVDGFTSELLLWLRLNWRT